MAVKQRLRYWDHERPEWALLSAVSRQMQREASDVVYSARDTFFVPLGSIDDDGWWCIPRPFAQVKRLDIAFDMQNITENIAYTLQCVKYRQDKLDGTPGRTPFEELTNAERWDLLHEKNKEGFTFDIWPSTISACIGIDGLDLLRLDLTNWRYPVGCCRMGHTLLGYLDGNGYNYRHPKRIEIVGMLEREQHICRDMLAHSGKIPLDCVFFVDGQGCTCKVSSPIYCIHVQTIDRPLRKEQAATQSSKCSRKC